MGAPLGQNLQPQTNRSGALWKCPITALTDDCEQVITDGRLCKIFLIIFIELNNCFVFFFLIYNFRLFIYLFYVCRSFWKKLKNLDFRGS